MFEDLYFKPLTINDVDQNLLDIISELSDTSGITVEDAKQALYRQIDTGVHHSFAACLDEKIIGIGSILVDYKIAHWRRPAIHIEDVAIHPGYQLKGIGRRLIEHLEGEAAKYNPYKIILDCSEKNVEFYEKCGYSRNCVCLRKDIHKKGTDCAAISV